MKNRTLAAGEVRLVPLAREHAGELRRIRGLPEVERWWDPPEDDFPLDDEPEATRYAVTLGDRVVGMVQYGEELEPKYRSASIDIFLDPAVHGQGVGSTAVRLVADHLLYERGHHRLEIDPPPTTSPPCTRTRRPASRRSERSGSPSATRTTTTAGTTPCSWSGSSILRHGRGEP